MLLVAAAVGWGNFFGTERGDKRMEICELIKVSLSSSWAATFGG